MEQRQYTRIPFVRRARVAWGNQAADVCCLELSLCGLLLSQPEHLLPWRPRQEFQLSLCLGEQRWIQMQCRLVHCDEDVFGCQIECLGVEDLTRLFRILSFNLPSVQNELRQRIAVSHQVNPC